MREREGRKEGEREEWDQSDKGLVEEEGGEIGKKGRGKVGREGRERVGERGGGSGRGGSGRGGKGSVEEGGHGRMKREIEDRRIKRGRERHRDMRKRGSKRKDAK